jgi:integrase
VLGLELPWLEDVVRAKRPQYLPVVLTRDETRAVLQRLNGVSRIKALLPYGAGLRLLECCRLRVKDVDFAASQIVIRDGKGRKDRVTMLPAAVRSLLAPHIPQVRAQHEVDPVAEPGGSSYPEPSCGSIHMPGANGHGSGSSPPRDSTWMVSPGSAAATISTNPFFSVP